MRKPRNALIAAIPAHGDHSGNEYVETTDRGPGAHATFSHLEGEWYGLAACDDDKDGFGVRGRPHGFRLGGAATTEAVRARRRRPQMGTWPRLQLGCSALGGPGGQPPGEDPEASATR